MTKKELKQEIINQYYELRKKGVSHPLAFAVCIEMAMTGDVASDDTPVQAQDEVAVEPQVE